MFVTLEVWSRLAQNLDQINVISFLALPRNLFEPTLENSGAISQMTIAIISDKFLMVFVKFVQYKKDQ